MRTDTTRLLSVHYFKSQSTHEHEANLRIEAMDELIVMLGGVYRAWQSEADAMAPVEARAGDVVYWPKGAVRVEESEPRDPMRCIAIYFVWDPSPIRQFPLPVRVRDQDGVIRILANRLLNLRSLPLAIPAIVPHQLAAAITAELLYLLSSRIDTLVGRVAQYVECHMSIPFTLTDLANEVGLQRHHFGRRFKVLTGISPMDYVRRRKADHALNSFLADPHHTPGEIADAVGVKDTDQLRRLLKQNYGLTVRDITRQNPDRATRKIYSANAMAAYPWMSPITASLFASAKKHRPERKRNRS